MGALEKWTSGVRGLGEKWRTACRQQHPFKELDAEWQLVCKAFGLLLHSVNQNRSLLVALMKLVAVADEASESVGAPLGREAGADDYFLAVASKLLEDTGSLCRETHWSRVRVLPRMHTPQNGPTDRSFSFYLSLCDSLEVIPQWLSTQFIQRDSFNLLMVPWPMEVLVRQFRDVTDLAPEQLPEDFGFFTYDFANAEGALLELIQALYEEARRKLGRVDGVILPELGPVRRRLSAAPTKYGSLSRRCRTLFKRSTTRGS